MSDGLSGEFITSQSRIQNATEYKKTHFSLGMGRKQSTDNT